MGNTAAKRRVVSKGSQTAGYTCFSRACAALEKDERLRGPDDLAEVFLPPVARIPRNVLFLRRTCMRRMFPPGIHEYVLARTRLLDSVFADALDRRFPQIVLLGSDMDTWPVRFRHRNTGTTVFDLDIYATQAYKRSILSRRGVELPRALVFAPIDFETQSIAEVLADVGFQEKKRTLFLWEGVTMYLTAAVVDQTLDYVRRSAGEGSVIAFDYIYASVLRRQNTRYGEDGVFDMVARTGEGWQFDIEEGAIQGFLSERGLKLLAHYSPADLETAFLSDGNGGHLGRVNGTHCIVVAGT